MHTSDGGGTGGTINRQGGRAATVWALNAVLVPVVREGISRGIIRLARGQREGQLVGDLRRLFAGGMILTREGLPVTLATLTKRLGIKPSPLRTLLAKVDDWNWMVDNLRLVHSDQGPLGLENSVLVLKSVPIVRAGASIFGVASRSMPEALFERLNAAGVGPDYNASPHSLAIDPSAWLVEIAPHWRFPLRVEPLVEGTWFDPERYDNAQRRIVEPCLHEQHGLYTTSTRAVIEEDVLGSFLATATELQGGAAGALFESGCLQGGALGVDEVFVGARLEEIRMIERNGGRPFFDLARVPVRDPNARRRMPKDPWSGTVRMGEEDCTFLLEEGGVPRSRDEMSWAAQMELGRIPRRDDLEGIFRPVAERIVQYACPDLRGVRYVVALAWVGKGDASPEQRQKVGLLVRDHQAEVGSGWSVPFADVFHPAVQVEVIALAEAHLRRVGTEGEFFETVSATRKAGVQIGQMRSRSQIEAFHGLTRGVLILNTRAEIGT